MAKKPEPQPAPDFEIHEVVLAGLRVGLTTEHFEMISKVARDRHETRCQFLSKLLEEGDVLSIFLHNLLENTRGQILRMKAQGN